jgi:hypothetical protein
MQKSKENLVSSLLMASDVAWLKGTSFENDLNTKVCFGDDCLGGVVTIQCDKTLDSGNNVITITLN